jgi:hypothetical protein
LHHLPTFQNLGVQFGVSESTTNYIFHRRIKILRELLPPSLLEKVKKNDSEYLWVIEILTEFALIVDSYDRAIRIPKNYQQHKKTYERIAKNTYQKEPTNCNAF